MDASVAHLPAKERQLLLLIQQRGRILTRLKERGSGDVESVQPPLGAGSASLKEDDVLTCLHALESRGLVRSEATVFRASTTEYVCEWTLCSEGQQHRAAG